MNYRGTIAYRTGIGSHVTEGFCASLVAAYNFLHKEARRNREVDHDFHFMRGLSCMLHDSANQIAEGFLGEWVIFLDTDHVFQSDALFEMITTFEEENLDILTGFAQQRQPPYMPLIFNTEFNAFEGFKSIIPQGIDRHRLIEVDSSGLACLMVRRSVFEAIAARGEKPFDMRKKFNATHLDTHVVLNEVVGPLPQGRHIDETFWEDVSFFWRAQMLGFQAFCAPWIKFHHLETRLVDESMINAPAPKDPRIPV